MVTFISSAGLGLLALLVILLLMFVRFAVPRLHAAALLLQARNLIKRGGHTSEALHLLTHVLALCPTFALAYVLRSQVRFQRGEDAEALADADRAVRHAPRNYRVYMLRALLRDYFGEYDEAIRDLQSAIFYNPNWREGYLDLAMHHLALGAPERSLEALEMLNARAGRHPLRYNALVMAGLIYEENLCDFDTAIRYYSQAIALTPDRRVAHLMRAWALRAQGNYQAAATDLLYAARCPQPPEDKGLYDWLQAPYDPWLYLVAQDLDDHNAWRAVLRSDRLGGLLRATEGDAWAPPHSSQTFLN